MGKKSLPFSFPLSSDAIARQRAFILSRLLAYDEAFCQIPAHGISRDTLNRMLELYDGMFLGGFLRKLNVRVTLSSRLTSAAGKFLFVRGAFGRIKQAEIRMSSDFLLRLDQGPFELNGLSVATPQEAFLLVFEHELCHALETALYGQTGHSARFLSLANGLFGHTATRHKLPTRRIEAAQQGLIAGMTVSFSHNGQSLSGVITYIGKMATVMVPDSKGEYRDKSGRKYAKYRVPLDRLSQ
ncbi:MAG: hypothetical protein IJ418_14880 [Clostridia bacterium]|nr:hypothetical protein [Clostridia bacterium]